MNRKMIKGGQKKTSFFAFLNQAKKLRPQTHSTCYFCLSHQRVPSLSHQRVEEKTPVIKTSVQ
ncbi:hypothetical protein CSV60_05925 [Sporosarcina sp. P7]|nr:hypothetical protein CSV60_05925 [Sporosarcina sp. P7]